MIHRSERVENRRVLAVDDDPLILALYKRLFAEGQDQESSNAKGYESELDSITGLLGGKSASQEVDPFERAPYVLTSCSQGLDAVAAVKQARQAERPFAVALIDMRMPPGIDGLETARQIRTMDQEMQLVFVTAYSDHSTDEICAEVRGQVLFFHKPLQMDELYQTVRNCCWSWNQADELKKLKENLEYQVELQTQRLRERIRSTDLLHQNAVMREKRIVELNHKNTFLQAYNDLRLILSKKSLSTPYPEEVVRKKLEKIGYPVTLLLVDDSEVIRKSYQAHLQSIGFEVKTAESVDQAMDVAVSDPPDLALIDFHMAVQTGDQLIQRMRENPNTTLVLPILFTNVGDEVSAAVAGAIYCLQKDQGLEVTLRKMGLIRDYLLDKRLSHAYPTQEQEFSEAEGEKEAEVENRRVLLVDDEQANLDFLLSTLGESEDGLEFDQNLDELMGVFGMEQSPASSAQESASQFDITTTTQGQDAITAVLEAQQAGAPFAIALIDMRMLPGIDGLETARQIRQISNEIEIVISTAYSDYTLDQIRDVLGSNFSFMEKPFNPDEVYQRVVEGCSKWSELNQTHSSHQALLGLAEEMQQEIRRRKEIERKLEHANKTKDDFLSSMSHELRTPLTTIIGYNEVLREESEIPEQYRGMLDSSVLAGKTLLQLVNDILDMSKLRSGKFELNEQPFDLRKMLIDLSELIKVFGSEKGVTVRLKIASEVESLLQTQWIGDDIRISQILFNLLSNAVKFSDGRGEVLLRLGLVAAPEMSVPGVTQFKLQVKDQGVGMSRETVSRLFTPFEQADSSTSRRFGGTGLGLFIAQQLVQMMGGSIQVESEVGVGSIFTAALPLQRTDLKVVASEVQEASGARRDIPQLSGRVLLAEDTVQLQRLAVLLIEKCGLQVDVVNNGLEALEMGQANEYGLILMDMQMPEMDGIEATHELRQRGCNTPVVALTANVMNQHRSAFEIAGCNGFISKPIKRSVLYAELERYFSQAEIEQTVVESASIELLEEEEDLSSLIDAEMWEEFWDYLTDAEQDLQRAWEEKSWDQVRSVAHAIKGMGSSYGQPEMTGIAAALQDGAPGEDQEVIDPLCRQLIDLLQQKNPNRAK